MPSDPVYDFEDLHKAVRHAFDDGFVVRRKPGRKGIKWTGPKIAGSAATLEVDFKEQLDANGLEYAAARGQDALDVLIRCAIQLGFMQGEAVGAGRQG